MKRILFNTFLFTSTICAQLSQPIPQGSNNLYLFEQIQHDASRSLGNIFNTLKSPLYFDNNDWNLFGTISAMTLASLSVDQRVRNGITSTKSKSLDNITYYGEKFGRPIYGGLLSGLLYTGGIVFKDNYVRETGQILAEALIINGISTIGLKLLLGRDRPYSGDGQKDFDLFSFETGAEDLSLPSGHTSTAFTVATVLSERFDNIYASVLLYSLASLTAYQRVYSDVHWFSDTLLGAILGTYIGLKIVKLHEKDSPTSSGYNLNIFPKVTPTNYEVGISLQF